MHDRRLFGARYLVKSEEEAKHCGLDEPVSRIRRNKAIMRSFHADRLGDTWFGSQREFIWG